MPGGSSGGGGLAYGSEVSGAYGLEGAQSSTSDWMKAAEYTGGTKSLPSQTHCGWH